MNEAVNYESVTREQAEEMSLMFERDSRRYSRTISTDTEADE